MERKKIEDGLDGETLIKTLTDKVAFLLALGVEILKACKNQIPC